MFTSGARGAGRQPLRGAADARAAHWADRQHHGVGPRSVPRERLLRRRPGGNQPDDLRDRAGASDERDRGNRACPWIHVDGTRGGGVRSRGEQGVSRLPRVAGVWRVGGGGAGGRRQCAGEEREGAGRVRCCGGVRVH